MIPQRPPAEPERKAERILILGGYGHFGARVSRALALRPGLDIIVAGRSLVAARTLVAELRTPVATRVAATALDHRSPAFRTALARLDPAILIHAAGPFQDQDYGVAETCIDLGIHYVDLADGREFVAGIHALDRCARAQGVLVVAGASTLPALSDAVLRELTADMAKVTGIEITIAPGQRTPRGLATVTGVLSYCGRPFYRRRGGQWVRVYGWQGLRRKHFPRLGSRWLAPCDVPDLALLPQRFPEVTDVAFHAALELAPLTFGMWMLSWLSRWQLVKDWTAHAQVLSRAADLFDRFGSDVGGMHVGVSGTDARGRRTHKDWHLTAGGGHGPQIPATPAVLIATKLAGRQINRSGALPCTGLLTLDDFAAALVHLDISWEVAAKPTPNAAPTTISPDTRAGDTRKGKLYPLQS